MPLPTIMHTHEGVNEVMYEPRLETFVCVAELGSYSAASKACYITPPAVIKQINSLEKSLGFKLFNHSAHGLVLTNAGQSLYHDAKYIIRYCKESIYRASNAACEDANTIRIGSSPVTPARLFGNLWEKVNEICPDIKFQIVPFQNTRNTQKKVIDILGNGIDIVCTVFDSASISKYGCKGLELSRVPFQCAMSFQHPLAAKKNLQISELYGETLFLPRSGQSDCVDRMRSELQQNHEKIHIKDYEYLSIDLFNHCQSTNDLLLAVSGWETIHPLIKIVPVEWDYSISYGILHASTPSAIVQRFLEASEKIRQELTE